MSNAGIAADEARTAREPFEGSVAGILKGAGERGTCDLVDAAGLYDDLLKAVAARRTSQWLAMPNADGRFLFANVSDRTTDGGVMEVFMNRERLLH